MDRKKRTTQIYNGYRFRGKTIPSSPGKKMSSRINYTGKRFGRLLVVECLGVDKGSGFRWWGCVCDCGQKLASRSRELLRGHTQSCGCLNRDKSIQRGAQNKLPAGHAMRNELLASYRKSARVRGIEWKLSDETFFELITKSCDYCGSPPGRLRKGRPGVNGGYIYSGLDRINNAIGYLPENTAPCCWLCNRAKAEMPLDQFLDWIKRVYTEQFTAARSARFEHGETPR